MIYSYKVRSYLFTFGRKSLEINILFVGSSKRFPRRTSMLPDFVIREEDTKNLPIKTKRIRPTV